MKTYWYIPPEQSAEFVWRMEDVLDVYQRPIDEKRPLVCLDEASKQLLSDARPPLPMEPGKPARQAASTSETGRPACSWSVSCSLASVTSM